MDYGHFSEDGREYIITRPNTPRPWVNCLTNGAYTAIVSHTGGGYSFIGGPGYDRITRADPDIAASDRPGRYVFVRDNDSGEYFSIGWQPVRRQPDWFECRHAPGITSVASSHLGIVGRIMFFVPLDDNLEIWRLRIQNTRSTPADLSVFTYVEWVLGNYADDLEARQISNLFNSVSFRDNYIVATKTSWRRPDSASLTLRETRTAGGPKFMPETMTSNQPWGKWAFIALSAPVVGFDCDRQAFIGRCGELARPVAVEEGRCTNSEGIGRDAVGVLQTALTIRPGHEVTFDVFLGIALHEGDPSGIAARCGEPGVVDEKLDAVVRFWNSCLPSLTVSTPDQDFDRAVNIWDKYQAWVSVKTSGMASLYRGGASIISFRDNCHGLLGVLPLDVDLSKQHLVDLMQHQFQDGSTVHYWEPRSDVGARTGHLDDPLWLVFAITSFLKETGEIRFLDDKVKYYYSRSPATVYEHLVRALDFVLMQISPRRLSLLGPGDWNDAIDQAGREGKGVSILTSLMLCSALFEGAEVAGLYGDAARGRAWILRAREIGRKINEIAWDGEWYIRAITDGADVIGSGSNAAGRIYLNPQTWSILSETAPVERAVKAMEGVRERLSTPYGPALVLPAYSREDRGIGTITRFAPGTKENGGIFTVAAAWAIMAECKLGRGARAYEILRKLLRPARAEDPERYMAEPYLYPEHIFGPDSDLFGSGYFTWTAGPAAWVFRTCLDWICGVRPEHRGLRIDPCIPPEWKEFTIVRPFRNAAYRITVRNPNGAQKGVGSITVDGKRLHHGALLPDFRDGRTHEVEVTM